VCRGATSDLKEFTRGRTIDAATLAAFIDTLPLAPAEKSRLRALKPADYTGPRRAAGAPDLRAANAAVAHQPGVGIFRQSGQSANCASFLTYCEQMRPPNRDRFGKENPWPSLRIPVSLPPMQANAGRHSWQ